MSGAMEKALHAAFVLAGLVTFLLEELLDGAVDIVSPNAGAHFLEGDLLAVENGVIEFSNRFTGATADDRACNVAEIPGLLRTRQLVENDRFVYGEIAITEREC